MLAGLLTLLLCGGDGTAQKPVDVNADFGTTVRALLAKYCLGCHST